MAFERIVNYYKYILRSIKLNVNRNCIVIDVGSGHAPLIRADILCDLPPLEDSQRPVAGIYTPPKRFVVGDVLELPFVTKAFDFAFSRAVLEHVSNPLKACQEISRIAHKGLLILPSYLWEIMGGSEAHLWLISKEKNKLVFDRKTVEHSRLNSQIPEIIRDSKQYENLFDAFYNDFYIEFYWENNIPIEVKDCKQNEYYYEEKEIMVSPAAFNNKFSSPRGLLRKLKILIFEMVRKISGGKDVDLLTVIACPNCKKGFSFFDQSVLTCDYCNLSYPIIDDVPFLMKRYAKVLS